MYKRHVVGSAFVCLLLAGSSCMAEDAKWPAGFPGSKMAIETPLKRIIGKGSARSDFEDLRLPVRPELARKSDSRYGRTVQPGLVAWHADLADASTRSANSGKPVLVFQMMGKLDQEFC